MKFLGILDVQRCPVCGVGNISVSEVKTAPGVYEVTCDETNCGAVVLVSGLSRREVDPVVSAILGAGHEMRRSSSAQPCGCDPGCDWVCEEHQASQTLRDA